MGFPIYDMPPKTLEGILNQEPIIANNPDQQSFVPYNFDQRIINTIHKKF